MIRAAFDSNVVIAGLLSWHEHHERAATVLNHALNRGPEAMVVPLPVLMESFAVMTRLPPPHRIAAGDAYHMLSASFKGCVDVTWITAQESWKVLQGLSEQNQGGGLTYDAQILAACIKAKAKMFYTFNRDHFLKVLRPNDSIEIVVP